MQLKIDCFPWKKPDVEDANDYGDSILDQGIARLSEEPDAIMLRQQRISKLASHIQACLDVKNRLLCCVRGKVLALERRQRLWAAAKVV